MRGACWLAGTARNHRGLHSLAKKSGAHTRSWIVHGPRFRRSRVGPGLPTVVEKRRPATAWAPRDSLVFRTVPPALRSCTLTDSLDGGPQLSERGDHTRSLSHAPTHHTQTCTTSSHSTESNKRFLVGGCCAFSLCQIQISAKIILLR